MAVISAGKNQVNNSKAITSYKNEHTPTIPRGGYVPTCFPGCGNRCQLVDTGLGSSRCSETHSRAVNRL